MNNRNLQAGIMLGIAILSANLLVKGASELLTETVNKEVESAKAEVTKEKTLAKNNASNSDSNSKENTSNGQSNTSTENSNGDSSNTGNTKENGTQNNNNSNTQNNTQNNTTNNTQNNTQNNNQNNTTNNTQNNTNANNTTTNKNNVKKRDTSKDCFNKNGKLYYNGVCVPIPKGFKYLMKQDGFVAYTDSSYYNVYMVYVKNHNMDNAADGIENFTYGFGMSSLIESGPKTIVFGKNKYQLYKIKTDSVASSYGSVNTGNLSAYAYVTANNTKAVYIQILSLNNNVKWAKSSLTYLSYY